ncbi:hypothetical protein PLIIFM63780_010252 [Purpureocillium lilacinum]|nr:hypothetical protein PLIIFM63780_010252 [Purpureocillium lilacinum]
MNRTSASADAAFGPQLTGQFDFTLLFEHSVLSIGPSLVILLVSSARVALLSKSLPIFRTSSLLWTKLAALCTLLGLQLAILALWSTSPSSVNTRAAIAAAALSAVVDLAIGGLVYAEHRRSYSPSTLLSLYLSATILVDIANVRSLFLRRNLDTIGAVSTAALALKLLILVLEEVPKRNVDLTVWPSKLVMVVGPVGSGKSTLLKAILGEARLLRGHVHLARGPVAYCDPTAWLRLGSVRDNILGPNKFDEKWYATVLRACALERDVSQLDDGNMTCVGSGGNALSGGQKQRVSLARAVYSRCPILLLDNVFSALDQQTARGVFARLLGAGGLLREAGRTVVLATHALEYLSSADIVVALDQNVWLVLAAGYIFSGKLPQIRLRIWTEHGTTSHAKAYFGAYLGFGVICTLFSGACVYFFMVVAVPKSAQHLHWLLLEAVLAAPLWFFTSTDTSSVLNRFSQDMTLVDQVLPMSVFTTTFDVYNVVAGAALIASGATYVAAIIPVCVVAIYFIQKFYLRTSRQMRHLDLEAKSPLYRVFTETAAGIITVRAFGWKTDMANENLRLLEHSQKPYYTMYCIQRWLNVVLDILVAAIAIVLVGFALGFSNTATQGSIGLALINVMEFNQSLSMLINSWTGLETSLGAIARLKSFIAETKTEGLEIEDEAPPADWPQRGVIQMMNVTAKYNAEDGQPQSPIRNVDLDIQPGQKVAIIGRTGSGKSSLLLTLLHLLDMEAGRVTIDGIDLSRVPRQALRSAIVAIPQDAVELPGSVRENLALDREGSERDDETMQQALRRVGLWDLVSERGGPGCDLDDIGLSAGQKQLFSLARALLTVQRRQASGGIVLMDEPTSSVDEESDAKVHGIVAEVFAGYTILTVSHRLDAARDADVVVRMDGGGVVEMTRG